AAARRPVLSRPGRRSAARGAAARDARRRRLPGSSARRRRPSRRLQRGRGGGAAARDEPQALARGARAVAGAVCRARPRAGRGGETRPPDVKRSDAGCTIEEGGAVRVGLKYVTGLGDDDAEAVAANRPYSSIREVAQRTGLSEDELRALAESGACDGFGLQRRELLWQLGLVPRPTSVPGTDGKAKQLALPLEPTAATPDLPEPTVWERMLAHD